MSPFPRRSGWRREWASGERKTWFSSGAPRSTLPPTRGRPGGSRISHLTAGRSIRGACSDRACIPHIDATGTLPLPRSPGPHQAYSGGSTPDASWGPFFRLYHPFFVPLSPGLKGKHLGTNCVTPGLGQNPCNCLLTDTRAGSGRRPRRPRVFCLFCSMSTVCAPRANAL